MDKRKSKLQQLIDEFRDRVRDRVKEESLCSPFLNMEDRQTLVSVRLREEIAEKVLVDFVDAQLTIAAAPEVRGFSLHKMED
jgi:hypothetical protein